MLLLIHGIMGLFFVVLGIVFLCGKVGFLIAGYNTAGLEEKAQYDEKALCRAMGILMFACAAYCGVLMLSTIVESMPLMWVGIALLLLVPMGGVIYMNTSKKVKRK